MASHQRASVPLLPFLFAAGIMTLFCSKFKCKYGANKKRHYISSAAGCLLYLTGTFVASSNFKKRAKRPLRRGVAKLAPRFSIRQLSGVEFRHLSNTKRGDISKGVATTFQPAKKYTKKWMRSSRVIRATTPRSKQSSQHPPTH